MPRLTAYGYSVGKKVTPDKHQQRAPWRLQVQLQQNELVNHHRSQPVWVILVMVSNLSNGEWRCNDRWYDERSELMSKISVDE